MFYIQCIEANFKIEQIPLINSVRQYVALTSGEPGITQAQKMIRIVIIILKPIAFYH